MVSYVNTYEQEQLCLKNPFGIEVYPLVKEMLKIYHKHFPIQDKHALFYFSNHADNFRE